MVSVVTNSISLVILCFFFYGRSLRKKNTELHIKIMSGVIFADISLVLFLTLVRSALSKVNSGMPVYLMVHIFFALSTVILYGFAIFVGLKLKNGETQYLNRMRLIDKFLTPTRVMNFLTSSTMMFY